MSRVHWMIALLTMFILAGCGNFSLPGINGPRTPVPVATVANTNPAKSSRASRNWSGYEIVRQGVTSITGTWQVPGVNGPTNADASTWVGIGGDRSPSLIQAGTDQLVQNGQAFYSAWYELLPDPPVTIKELTILPGDTVAVTLAQTGTQQWTLTFTDKDAHMTVTKPLTYLSCNCSAEWVEEAPSVNGHETTLANFSSVTFTGCAVIISGRTVNLASGGARPIRMTDVFGRALAQPQVAQSTSFSIVDISPQQRNQTG